MEASDEQGAAILAAPSNGNGAGRRLTVEDFTAAALVVDKEEVAIEGLGTVVVRGFTKSEHRWMLNESRGPDGEVDEERLEPLMFHKGLADPQLTLGQVQKAFDTWNVVHITRILDAIARVSGLVPGFVREAVATFRDGPGAGVPVPVGAGPGDDGDPSEGADAGA